MPVVRVVKGGEQQALPVFLLITFLHTKAGAIQWLQWTQEEPDVDSQSSQGDRWNIIDADMEDLRKEQKKASIQSSWSPLHG